MSHIEELIQELCPDGVECAELQAIFTTKGGYTPSTSDPAAWADGTVPWFRMEDIRDNGRVLGSSLQQINESAVKGGRLFPANSILVATSATIGEHALITVPHLSNQRFTSLTLKPEYVDRYDIKFVFYYCFVLDEWCRNNTTTSSFASVDMPGFKKFKFPVPPLGVQHEIVRVLDKFTELEAQLEAELEMRRTQYEHYMLQIVNDSQAGDKVSLGELEKSGAVKLGRGKVISKITIEATPGDYPVYSSSGAGIGEFGRYGEYMFDDERITWSVDGGGRFFYRAPHRYSVTNVSGWMQVDTSRFLVRYLYYVLTALWSRETFDYTRKAHPSVIRELYMIAEPSLEVQRNLVQSLDNFDALVNDISIGLPAEIAARRKQYEHYRDRLLTFKELAT